MSSNENPPSLSLSDIMHPMSPSPTPGEPDEHQSRYDPDAQQEPLTDAEVLIIRNRLQELGLVMPFGSENEDLPIPQLGVVNHLNLREKELTDMILRLTSCPRIDTTQLEEQATTISTLTTQRDYLIADAEEERLKLQSERENWDRTAEALLTQKTRPLKTDDMDAHRAAYEAEIKSLRDKLHDRHRRLSALEQEILRLKPLLLMQPYSNQRLKQTLTTQNIKAQDKGKRREVDVTPTKMASLNIIPAEIPLKFNPTAYPYGYQYKPEASIPSGQSSNSHTFLLEGPPAPAPGTPRRRSKDHSSTQKGRKPKYHRSTTITSDAYAEHVLLAAQRIGRKRASLVTGLQRLADREKEALARENDQLHSRKELERLEKERLDRLASGTPSMAYYRPSEEPSPHRDDASRATSTPSGSKTPRRGGYSYSQRNANPGGVNTPPPSTYVFVNTSATRMSKTPATYSPGTILNTPSRPEATLNSFSTIRATNNPPTPLDSLVDAARMMDESGDRSNPRRRLPEEPQSPTAKRRKVTDKVLVNRGASKLGRVKSGLDVLADQAAAVNNPGQTSTQPSANDSLTISDRKGKGKANALATDAEWSTPSNPRGSTRTIRPPSRRLLALASQDGLRSASSSTRGRGTIKTQGLARHAVTPESRVIALPTVASSGFDSSGVTRVGLNLRPVSGWGDRPVPDDDEEDSNSDSTCDSPTRNGLGNERPGFLSTGDLSTLEVNNPLLSAARPDRERALPPSVTLGATHDNSDAAPVNGYDEERGSSSRTPTHHIVGDSQEIAPTALAQSSIRQTLATGRSEASRSPLPADHPDSKPPPQEPSRQLPFGPVHADHRESEEYTADAAGSDVDEDEDAEGEEDEENTENDAEVGSRYHPSRSRSPPPPDPPGNDNGPGPSNEQDPDADADGDMDVDDKGTPPSGTSPATHQTRGGHHREAVTFVTDISIKPSYNIPMFFLARCLAASPKQLSSCAQHSRVSSIRTIAYNVGNCATPQQTKQFHRGMDVLERDDSICDTVGYCLISKSASIISH